MADFFAGVFEFLVEALLPPYGKDRKRKRDETDDGAQ